MKNIMKNLDLSENLLNRTPFKLSSGEKRKVILASILLKKPSIILFDESTAFLDPKSRVEFIKLIKKINNNYKTSIIFVSHNTKDVERLGGKTLLLDNGEIVMIDETKKVINHYRGMYE